MARVTQDTRRGSRMLMGGAGHDLKAAYLRRAGTVFRSAVMLFFLLFTVVPFIWMFGSAFRPVQEIFAYVYPVSWKTFIPLHFTADNLIELLLSEGSMWPRYIANSLFVAVAMVVGSGLINSMAAYGFARLRFPGREVLFVLVLATVIIPFEAIAVPLYLVMRQLDWIDSYQAIILPGVANAFTIFLLRQFFMGIPRELEEAAIVDGAGYLRVFFQIIIPLSRPALITTSIITFQAGWDAFIWPLIVTNTPSVRLIQIALSTLSGQDVTYWNHIFAGVAVAAVVPILIFVFLQRYYTQSMMTSGLKL